MNGAATAPSRPLPAHAREVAAPAAPRPGGGYSRFDPPPRRGLRRGKVRADHQSVTARWKQGWSDQQIAEALGVTRARISQIRSKLKLPSKRWLQTLAWQAEAARARATIHPWHSPLATELPRQLWPAALRLKKQSLITSHPLLTPDAFCRPPTRLSTPPSQPAQPTSKAKSASSWQAFAALKATPVRMGRTATPRAGWVDE